MTMQAYEIGLAKGLDSWRPATRAMPAAGPGQVLVRVRATSLNYRDVLIVTGRYPFSKFTERMIPLSDGAGDVVAVGEGVTRFAVGDRVAGIFSQSWLGGAQVDDAWATALGGGVDGMLAGYRALDEQGLVGLPDHLSFEEAATLPCAALTAWNALYGLSPLRPGQTVLALGTGGVSIFAAQFAHAAGARVIMTSSSDEKLRRARSFGAHDGINYITHPDWAAEIRRLTGGRGVDHVIEVGGTGTLQQSIACTHAGGTISLIGLLADGEAINPLAILGASVIVRGVLVGSREQFEAMNRAIAQNAIRPVVDEVFAFDAAPQALAALALGKHVGKIVIRMPD